MPPRKNPLEDARKRLQEKLDSIKEQSDYITQVLSTTVSNATNPAVELLNLKDRKKFFQKYSLVSQDLEKCLDFLLVLSDSVDAQGEDSDEEGSNDEEITAASDTTAKEEKKIEKVIKDETKEGISEKPLSNNETAAKFTSESATVKTTSAPETKPESEPEPEAKSQKDKKQEKQDASSQKTDCKTNDDKRDFNTHEIERHDSHGDISSHCDGGSHGGGSHGYSGHGDSGSHGDISIHGNSSSHGGSSHGYSGRGDSGRHGDISSHGNSSSHGGSSHGYSGRGDSGSHGDISSHGDSGSHGGGGSHGYSGDSGSHGDISSHGDSGSGGGSSHGYSGHGDISSHGDGSSHGYSDRGDSGSHGDFQPKSNNTDNQRNNKKLSQSSDNLQSSTHIESSGKSEHQYPKQEQRDQVITAKQIPVRSDSNSATQTSVVKNNVVPSQLKMPQAYNKKGLKRERNLESTGRRSPSNRGKEKKAADKVSVPKVIQLKPYPFKNGKCLEVVVTEVLSPWELWIQPADNGFNLLMEKMCMHFAKAAASGYKGGLSAPPSVGEFCCARFIDDDTWYRVRVIGVYQSDDMTKPSQAFRQRISSTGSTSSTSSIDNYYPGLEVEVLCPDDGNRERLPLSRLRPLAENLAVLPCQALCCALTGVQPLVQNTVKSQGDSLWKEESIEWLRNKVSGVKLLAYPKRTEDDPLVMVDLYLMHSKKKKRSPGRDGAIPGKDGNLPGLQFSIANIMISEGFAQRVGHVEQQPNDSRASSPQSVSSEGRLSRSSSLSMTSLQDYPMPVFDENVTQSEVTQRDLKDGKSVTRGADVVTQRDGTTEVTQEIRPSCTKSSVCQPKNEVQDNKQSQRHDYQKEQSSEVGLDLTHSQEHPCEESVTQFEVSQMSRESPRRPPDGSSLTEPLQELPDDISSKQSTENEQSKGRLYLPTQDQPLFLQVMMSEVVTPDEFYVHLVTPEAVLLAELTEDLDAYYKETDVTSTPIDYRLNIGDYCCAKFTTDNMWCRAKVLDVKVTPSGEGEEALDTELSANIYVCYLDYGNSEWVTMDNTRPLLPKFMILPGFAVKCRLAGVRPVTNEDDNEVPASNELSSDQVTPANPPHINQERDANSSSETSKPATSNIDPISSTPYTSNIDPTSSTPYTSNINPTSSTPYTSNINPTSSTPYTSNIDPTSSTAYTSNINPTSSTPYTSNIDPTSTSKPDRKSTRRRGKKNKKLPLNKNVVLRAAGDESGDSELSDGGLIFDFPKGKEKDMTSEESALPEKYLLPSPEKIPPLDKTNKSTNSRKPEWTDEAVELFKGLTGDDKPLRGVMMPWNATTYQQVYYPTASQTRVDITYTRPMLFLRLYDTTGDEDIDVVQIMIETGLAEICDDEGNLSDEDFKNQDMTARTLQLSVADLETTANHLEQEGTCVSPLGSSSSPTNIEDDVMTFWNPMMDDFKSSRNAYRIDTSDLDIAIHGFKPIETQYCRFFRSSKSRCWRGENCPLLHVKEGENASMRVQAFCNNNDFSVDLPKLDSWVGVRVTAVLNPGHFWVHFPCGSGPIEKKIIEERLGLCPNTEDEDFESMMERMNTFYSRNLFRDSTTILPAVGELVVAKYSLNGQWYRACVIDVMDATLKVSFVDFGNSEWTAENDVKRMLPQFLHLPFQAVECFLGNVEPVEESGEWTRESMEVFETLTQDKLLIAHVLSIARNNTMMCIELFDTQNENEININEEMIQQGFAHESAVQITPPTKPSSPGSISGTCSAESSDCEIIEFPG